MQDEDFLVESETRILLGFIDKTLTAHLSPEDIKQQFPDIDGKRSETVSRLAKKHQGHTCSKKCSIINETDGCLYHYPKLPSVKTIICSPLDPGINDEEAELLTSCSKGIKMMVRNKLKEMSQRQLNCVTMEQLLLESLGDVDGNERTEEGHYILKNGIFPHIRELNVWLHYFKNEGVTKVVTCAIYHTALSIATWKVDRKLVYQIVYKRNVNECFIAEYNPYCLEAMQSSMSFEFITHTPEKVLDYITKSRVEDKASMTEFLKTNTPRYQKDCFLEHRKVSLNECFYRIDTELSLSDTNVNVCYIDARFPEKRSSVYSKIEVGGIKLFGKEGQYVRKMDMIEKYANRTR